MTLKNVLVYVDNDSSCDNRIANGISLCRHYNAQLNGLYAMRMMEVHSYPYAYLPQSVFDSFDKSSRELCQTAKELFEAKIQADNLPGELTVVKSNLSEQLAIASRYADLLVTPTNENPDFDLNYNYSVTDLLFRTSCPMLVIPHKDTLLSPPLERLVVAWDGSREASRALRAALSTFPDVSTIEIVTVAIDRERSERIAEYLNLHKKEAKIHLVNGNPTHAGEELLEHTTSLGGQLLVMGAYSHSRLREEILGGVTRHILEHTEIPVLFSH